MADIVVTSVSDEDNKERTTLLSLTARDAVRLGFNPSKIERVNRLKILAAAFISECERGKSDVPDGAGHREYAVAITNMQTASMWAVLAATADIA